MTQSPIETLLHKKICLGDRPEEEVDYIAIEKKAKLMHEFQDCYLTSVDESMSEEQRQNVVQWCVHETLKTPMQELKDAIAEISLKLFKVNV